jgi:hypothetical protein
MGSLFGGNYKNTLKGAGSGAASGFAVGGPWGALAGGAAGGAAGYQQDKDKFGGGGRGRDREDDLGGLQSEARRASDFAGASQGRFGVLGGEADTEREYLRRIARGEESVSAGQLRNALQQNQAQQQSMAAGARGGNQAMAARQAAMTAGRQGAGLAGQQATAGIQERQSAQQALGNMLLQQRQQELSGLGQARGQAIQGYGGGFDRSATQPTQNEQLLELLKTGAQAYGTYQKGQEK